ncbi:MAG TPA: glycoside hydrolase domain-containing protein, partial [Pyrinomonadaceae bacterium]
MRKALFGLAAVIFSIAFFGFYLPAQKAQENPFRNMEIITTLQRSSQKNQTPPSAQIKNIQVFGEKSGMAHTSDALFRTDDDGETWREIILPRNNAEKIAAVYFQNENAGLAILTDSRNARLELAKTLDGGNNWTKTPIELRSEDLQQADLEQVGLLIYESEDFRDLELLLRAPTSSSFTAKIHYETTDGGNNWTFTKRSHSLRRSDESFENISGNWTLKTEGDCEGFKTGCIQETKIFNRAREITPPRIKELARLEKENARLQAQNSVFAAPPNGSTRISLNRGFDKCTAATAAQMQTWWNNSPFYDANIYISGRNRGCAQPQLTAAWVNQVSAMGWGLIPTIVGYQAPCSVCTSCQKHSSDPALAETQGRGEADIAIVDANNLGLTQGAVLYYDMERYDDVSGTGACSTPVKAFLKGWTDRLKEQGYISGVYGSPTNAVGDWINIPAPSRMDAIWMARWDNVASVWFYASPSPMIPNDIWANHQRIKQYQAPHNETWGGVTFNIDGNIADGPVAGVQPAKNKTADFDGDGRTDISVFRPETGSWYLVSSSNSGFSGINFGIANDILAPGDYDGDGKTDYAVFRPSDGTWYIQLRTTLRAQQFGTNGDIPVPADYNGDGFTDVAVFRPSNGYWYIWNSSGSPNLLRVEQFGANGDKPAPGDYDGDGKTDL